MKTRTGKEILKDITQTNQRLDELRAEYFENQKNCKHVWREGDTGGVPAEYWLRDCVKCGKTDAV